jgi:hypothetical protein
MNRFRKPSLSPFQSYSLGLGITNYLLRVLHDIAFAFTCVLLPKNARHLVGRVLFALYDNDTPFVSFDQHIHGQLPFL